MASNDSQIYPINYIAFSSTSIAISVASMLMNIFFVFSMVFPQGTEQLKQPLNVLLGSLVGCNIALYVFTLLSVFCDFTLSSSALVYDITVVLMLFTMRISVTSCLWLNVFYYCQIVPVQHPFIAWLKKNIRIFIYSGLIMDRIFFLSGFIVGVVYVIKCSELTTCITVITSRQNTTDSYMNILLKMMEVDFWLRFGYFLLCLCVMSASSGATVHFLWRHMKSMEESSNSLSSLHLQKQLRVTITGIVQALLYFLCSASMGVNEIIAFLFPHQDNLPEHIHCTTILLYSFGTTINMGVGQSIFRHRAADIWDKLLQTLASM